MNGARHDPTLNLLVIRKQVPFDQKPVEPFLLSFASGHGSSSFLLANAGCRAQTCRRTSRSKAPRTSVSLKYFRANSNARAPVATIWDRFRNNHKIVCTNSAG